MNPMRVEGSPARGRAHDPAGRAAPTCCVYTRVCVHMAGGRGYDLLRDDTMSVLPCPVILTKEVGIRMSGNVSRTAATGYHAPLSTSSLTTPHVLVDRQPSRVESVCLSLPYSALFALAMLGSRPARDCPSHHHNTSALLPAALPFTECI